MDDIKLLELAGKAAGETYSDERNPLACDALALRLAVKLLLRIDVLPWGTDAYPWNAYIDGNDAIRAEGDHCAATRRAITRAAAEIGLKMPDVPPFEVRMRMEKDEPVRHKGALWEARAIRFAAALVDIMDGTQDHHIQDDTGLCEAACERIAQARADAVYLLATSQSSIKE